MTNLITKVDKDFKFYSDPVQQQDMWVICNVLGGKREGFFVDAGACDGIKNSNSYALDTQLGWKGICIEAHPTHAELLQKNRSCYIEQAALWDETTELTFTMNLNISGTSGVLEEMNKPNRDRYYSKDVPKKEIKVQATSLVEVLRKYNAPSYIDYLSLDIEGAEYRALRNFPFDEYTFGCMTIEKSSANLLKLRRLLLSKGYRLVNVKGLDDYWVHPSLEYHLPLMKKLAIAIRKSVQSVRAILRGEG